MPAAVRWEADRMRRSTGRELYGRLARSGDGAGPGAGRRGVAPGAHDERGVGTAAQLARARLLVGQDAEVTADPAVGALEALAGVQGAHAADRFRRDRYR